MGLPLEKKDVELLKRLIVADGSGLRLKGEDRVRVDAMARGRKGEGLELVVQYEEPYNPQGIFGPEPNPPYFAGCDAEYAVREWEKKHRCCQRCGGDMEAGKHDYCRACGRLVAKEKRNARHSAYRARKKQEKPT